MSLNWRGVFPAATTQFAADQSLDVDATLRHFDVMIDAGVDGLVVLGTVGENCSLENDEKVELLKASVDHTRGRVPVIAGVAEYTTSLACRSAQAAEDAGCDGLMVLPAMVYKSDPRETVAHFRSVASSVDLPIMIYNNPVSYGVDVTPEMFDELADEPRFVAIKESSEDCRRITDIKNRCRDRYTLLCGIDDVVLESVMLGAVGWVSGLVNAFPRENRLLWDLAMAGRYEDAVEVYRWYTPLLHLDTHPKLVQYIKLAEAECGCGSETVRSPRLPLVEPERSQILSIIRRAIESRPIASRFSRATPSEDGSPHKLAASAPD
jgi:1-pyrroline-4-hydroxy-2-carboxylate deaminase